MCLMKGDREYSLLSSFFFFKAAFRIVLIIPTCMVHSVRYSVPEMKGAASRFSFWERRA